MKSTTASLRMVKREPFSVQVSKSVTIACNLWYPSISSSTTVQNQRLQNNQNNDDAAAPTNFFTKTTVVFCHQFGKMGGSGNLLVNMARLVVAESITKNQQPPQQQVNNDAVNNNNNLWSAVTFDFRGVGDSTGSSTWTCSDEVQDVEALCKFFVTTKGVEKIFIVGSSAGASIAGSALDCIPQIAAGCFIAYTYGYLSSILFSGHYEKFLKSTKPKLLFHATEDGFTSMAQFQDLMKNLKGDKNESVIVEGVGHFEVEQPQYDSFMAKKIYEFCSKY